MQLATFNIQKEESGWQPKIAEGWPDIRKIFADDPDPNKRQIFMLTDSNLSIIIKNAEIGNATAYYKTSDGKTYSGSDNYEHTWDLTQDITTTLGYKCRWLIAYSGDPLIACDIRTLNIKWSRTANYSKLISYLTGNSNINPYNTIVESMECDDSVIFSYPNTISYIGFYWSRSLENLILPKGVTNVWGNMFYQTLNLKQLDFLDDNISFNNGTSNLFSLNYAMENFDWINKVIISNLTASSVLNGFKRLKKIELPDTITVVSNLFQDCTGLIRAKLSKTCTVINGTIFSNCNVLSYVYIPKSVITISNTTNLFNNCYALSTIEIEEGWVIPQTTGFNMSSSNMLSYSGLISLFNNFGDNSANPTVTITIGAVNLAKLQTEEGQAALLSATNKNYTIA